MRTSSIKSFVTTLTLAAMLLVAVPAAEARTRSSRNAGRTETFAQAVVKMMKRFGRVFANGAPSIPPGSPTMGDPEEGTPEVTPEPTTTPTPQTKEQ